MLWKMFPNKHIKFAFLGNHIDRYRSVGQRYNEKIEKVKKTPQFDLILAVDDNQLFHKQNLDDNKEHYTIFARATFG